MSSASFSKRPGPHRFFLFRLFYAGLGLWAWSLLSGCVYFNTYYNANKAYRQAISLREKRLDKNPSDSVLATADEKLKFERCVTKCSKVLELYPEEKKWQSRAVFLMAEAYYQEGEWTRSIGKYDEFLEYFPNDAHVTQAEVHRGVALYQNGQYLAAHSALERMLEKPLDDGLRTEALLCLAKMEGVNGNDSTALAAYEKLLHAAAKGRFSRAQAHAAAARLAYRLKQWTKVREHALAPEIALLTLTDQISLHLLAADARFQQKQFAEGIADLEHTTKLKFFRDSLAPFRLKMAEGHLALNHDKAGFALIGQVTHDAPHTSLSAEGWYRRGDHEFRILRNEPAAKVSFDSAASQGMDFPFAKLAHDRADALAQLAEYRKKHGKDSASVSIPLQEEFMISELFLFQLDQMDSALVRLNRIADSPDRDSIYTLRAGYARAYIQEEYKHDKSLSDSLYRLLMERYPGTTFAKQAEKNLGLKSTVQTDEDTAHGLFLDAEKKRFGGEDILSQVIPAYGQVVELHPQTHSAAQAQFVMAMLYEGKGGNLDALVEKDSAIAAYRKLSQDYPRSEYAPLAHDKIAGIAPAKTNQVQTSSGLDKPTIPSSPNPPNASNSSSNPSSTGNPIQPTPENSTGPGGPHPIQNPPTYHGHGATPNPPIPTSDSSDADKPLKEVLEPDYDNVDQY